MSYNIDKLLKLSLNNEDKKDEIDQLLNEIYGCKPIDYSPDSNNFSACKRQLVLLLEYIYKLNQEDLEIFHEYAIKVNRLTENNTDTDIISTLVQAKKFFEMCLHEIQYSCKNNPDLDTNAINDRYTINACFDGAYSNMIHMTLDQLLPTAGIEHCIISVKSEVIRQLAELFLREKGVLKNSIRGMEIHIINGLFNEVATTYGLDSEEDGYVKDIREYLLSWEIFEFRMMVDSQLTLANILKAICMKIPPPMPEGSEEKVSIEKIRYFLRRVDPTKTISDQGLYTLSDSTEYAIVAPNMMEKYKCFLIEVFVQKGYLSEGDFIFNVGRDSIIFNGENYFICILNDVGEVSLQELTDLDLAGFRDNNIELYNKILSHMRRCCSSVSLQEWLSLVIKYPNHMKKDSKGETFLITAIRDNKIHYVRQYLSNRSRVDDIETTYQNKTALQWSLFCQCDHITAIIIGSKMNQAIASEPQLIEENFNRIVKNHENMRSELLKESIAILLERSILHPHNSVSAKKIFDLICKMKNDKKFILSINLIIKHFLCKENNDATDKFIKELYPFFIAGNCATRNGWLALIKKCPYNFMNITNGSGSTLLTNAICCNKPAIVRELLTFDNVGLKNRQDALAKAISLRHDDIAIMIFENILFKDGNIDQVVACVEVVIASVKSGVYQKSSLLATNLCSKFIEYLMINNKVDDLQRVLEKLPTGFFIYKELNQLIEGHLAGNNDNIKDESIEVLAQYLLQYSELFSKNWLALIRKCPGKFANIVNRRQETLLVCATGCNQVAIVEVLLTIDEVDLISDQDALIDAVDLEDGDIALLILEKTLSKGLDVGQVLAFIKVLMDGIKNQSYKQSMVKSLCGKLIECLIINNKVGDLHHVLKKLSIDYTDASLLKRHKVSLVKAVGLNAKSNRQHILKYALSLQNDYIVKMIFEEELSKGWDVDQVLIFIKDFMASVKNKVYKQSLANALCSKFIEYLMIENKVGDLCCVLEALPTDCMSAEELNQLIEDYLTGNNDAIKDQSIQVLAKRLLQNNSLFPRNWLTLIKKGSGEFANITNGRGDTLLEYAIRYNEPAIVKELLTVNNVDLDAKVKGQDALAKAISERRDEIAAMIFEKKLSKGCNVGEVFDFIKVIIAGVKSGVYKQSLANALCSKFIEYLMIENKVGDLRRVLEALPTDCMSAEELNQLIEDYLTGNNDAIKDQSIQVLAKKLLQNNSLFTQNWLTLIKKGSGELVNITNGRGETLLACATRCNEQAIVEVLLTVDNVDLDAKVRGQGVLRYATLQQHDDIAIKIFRRKLSKGWDIGEALAYIKDVISNIRLGLIERSVATELCRQFVNYLMIRNKVAELPNVLRMLRRKGCLGSVSWWNQVIKNFLTNNNHNIHDESIQVLAKYFLQYDSLSSSNWLLLIKKWPSKFANMTNKYGHTLLTYATCHNMKGIVKELLTVNDVALNAKVKGKEALGYAIHRGYNDVAVRIFEKKLSKDWDVGEALDCIETIVACINRGIRTTLYNRPLVKDLCSKLIEYLMIKNKVGDLQHLLEKIPIGYISEECNQLIEDHLTGNNKNTNNEFIQVLAQFFLKKGQYLSLDNWFKLATEFSGNFMNATDKYGYNLLIYAITNRNESMVKELLKSDNVDLNTLSKGKDALGWANFVNDERISNQILLKIRDQSKSGKNNNILSPQVVEAIRILEREELLTESVKKILFINNKVSTSFSKIIISLRDKGLLSMITENIMEKLILDNGAFEITSVLDFSDQVIKLYLLKLDNRFEDSVSQLKPKKQHDLFIKLQRELKRNFYDLGAIKANNHMKDMFNHLKLCRFKYLYKKRCWIKVRDFYLYPYKMSTIRYRIFSEDPTLEMKDIETHACQSDNKTSGITTNAILKSLNSSSILCN